MLYGDMKICNDNKGIEHDKFVVPNNNYVKYCDINML